MDLVGDIPAEFRAIRGTFPGSFERQMGYTGDRRWVAFYWHDKEDDVAWFDGVDSMDAAGSWEPWTRMISPLGNYFKANFGSYDDPARHMLVYDRQKAAAYVSPRDVAEEFLAEQAKKV